MEQIKTENQEKRFELSNKDNYLIYEGYQWWWYTDYDRCMDWCPAGGLIDPNWLIEFADRVEVSFGMTEYEGEILLSEKDKLHSSIKELKERF